MYNLYQGDCFEVMKGMPDKSIDCIICDYQSGMSLRKVAEKYQTNHHKITLFQGLKEGQMN